MQLVQMRSNWFR